MSGWLTCAECSSLGSDTWVGAGEPPKRGTCSSCGGPWPAGDAALHAMERFDRMLHALRGLR